MSDLLLILMVIGEW